MGCYLQALGVLDLCLGGLSQQLLLGQLASLRVDVLLPGPHLHTTMLERSARSRASDRHLPTQIRRGGQGCARSAAADSECLAVVDREQDAHIG